MNKALLEALGDGEVIVDLGCGGGSALDSLGERYRTRVGLDASEIRLCDRNLEDFAWDFRLADLNQRFPLEDGYADTVYSNQVIEHLTDPRHFVAEVKRILRLGGAAVITTPNVRYVKHLWELMVKGNGPATGYGDSTDGEWDNGHIHYFTHGDMRKLFIDAGFTDVHSRALINLAKPNAFRRALDKFSTNSLVREFLSGNILLVARK